MTRNTAAVVAVLLLAAGSAFAAGQQPVGRPEGPDAISVPQMMNYQGRLADSAGNPVNTPQSLRFKLFADSTGGTEFWSESQSNVPVTDGVFNVRLGSVSPISTVPDGPNCFLEVTVGSETVSPRIRLVSTGYAWRAARAEDANQLGGVAAASYAVLPIETAELKDSAVTMPKLNRAGATTGQAIIWNGSAWVPQTPAVGAHTHTASGDVTGTVTGTLTLAQKGAGTGQVLKWNGSAWQARNDSIGQDNDWVHGGDSVLYTIRRLGIARGGSNNLLHGSAAYTHVNLGIACTTGAVGQSHAYAAVGGGQYNTASNAWTVTGGGFSNTASAIYAMVGGGNYNTASGASAAIAGGWANRASGHRATIAGGYQNVASAEEATVAGGQTNTAGGPWVTIGGGLQNIANGYYATIAGGVSDTALGLYGAALAGWGNLGGDGADDSGATVGGGRSNRASAAYAFVGGGRLNRANDRYATIGGGSMNATGADFAAIGGGSNNGANGTSSVIGGGTGNFTYGSGTVVVGGSSNTAQDMLSAVGGGSTNVARESCAVIAGGLRNIARKHFSAVGGGRYNHAGDPAGVYGTGAVVPGGERDSARADHSFAANYHSVVPNTCNNSAAFNTTVATASGQLRCGALVANSKSFQIDHPNEPGHKLLNHFSVEAPELLVTYRGAAVLGPDGSARVSLPGYFEALTRNPMVQLTGVGTSDVYVRDDVAGNSFTIGGRPGTRVYWTVSAERRDVSAEITRALMPVEQEKTGELTGRSADDNYLIGTLTQLERMGLGSRFSFRTAAARGFYESLRRLE